MEYSGKSVLNAQHIRAAVLIICTWYAYFYLGDEVLAAFRERAGREGKGYQTLINETLRAAITPEAVPVTVEVLRRVLREELCGAA